MLFTEITQLEPVELDNGVIYDGEWRKAMR